MNILIVGQVDLTTQPVNPVTGFQVPVIADLITYMRVYKIETGKGQGESQDTQDRI
jgi:hypothetical protein